LCVSRLANETCSDVLPARCPYRLSKWRGASRLSPSPILDHADAPEGGDIGLKHLEAGPQAAALRTFKREATPPGCCVLEQRPRASRCMGAAWQDSSRSDAGLEGLRTAPWTCQPQNMVKRIAMRTSSDRLTTDEATCPQKTPESYSSFRSLPCAPCHGCRLPELSRRRF